MSGFIYLASPFWHESELMRLQRYAAVRNKTAEILAAGWTVFSPIVHAYHVHHLLHEGIRHNHDFWLAHDYTFIRKADALCVYQLAGWAESKGIARELRFAQEINLSIIYLQETDAIPTFERNKSFAVSPAQGVRSGEAAGAGGLDRPSGAAERGSGTGGER